jgi:predicted secreted protein
VALRPFEDKRSKRIVLVAHCVLNQNAKIDGCAHYPGVMREVAEALIESGCGIVQLPCPELLHLGLDRQVDRQSARTVESEDTRVGALMQEGSGTLCCRRVAEEIAYQVEQYQQNAFAVVGLLGINGSPTCGVETAWADGREVESPGALIREVQAALKRRGWNVPMRGIRAKDSATAVRVTAELLTGPAR